VKEQEMKQFVGLPIEAIVLDSRMIVNGTLIQVVNGHVKFSSIEDLFVLVHGKRLSIKLMLAGSFADLGGLLKEVCFPCSMFDKCRILNMKG
jgi:hypothetical protein